MHTELDNLAHQLILEDYYNGIVFTKIGKPFFVHHKESFPYTRYYNKAKIMIRKEKLIKIISKM